MSSSADFFLKKTLGEDFFQSLEKFELWKPGTKTVIDHEEMKTALKIVPRALMSFLISHLAPMQIGETKEIEIPLNQGQPKLRVTKHERDVYSGEIEDSTEKYTDKKVAEFKFRSLPGVGLIVMSTFELYSTEDLEKEPAQEISPDLISKIQSLIDERLSLHSLIGNVIDKKMAQRDAVQQLVLAKLTNSMKEPEPPKVEVNIENSVKVSKKVRSPLHDFLETRKTKLQKKEYSVQLTKSENIECPDCGQRVFSGGAFSGCVCLGDDMGKKIYLTKAENGYKVRFGRGWDPENIEMLLEVLRRKRG